MVLGPRMLRMQAGIRTVPALVSATSMSIETKLLLLLKVQGISLA